MQAGESEESLDDGRLIRDDEGRARRQRENPSRRRRFSPLSLVCISHAFSAWGDRMWHFAIGLYLVELTPNSLRLTAIYQLVSTLSIIVFGPLVGDWVDANPRLKVAQISLIVQNVAVILCAGVFIIILVLTTLLPHTLRLFLEALVIIIGSIADLSSVGTKIAVEKDWVVVISGSDKSKLASTNAILRRIDLSCKILAPILVGQLMTYIDQLAGVIFLAGWNVVSVFLEYYLLWKVFQSVAALSMKVVDTERHEISEQDSNLGERSEDDSRASSDRLDRTEGEDPSNSHNDTESLVPSVAIRTPPRARKPSYFARIKRKVLTFRAGWHIYMRQTVARPGLALAALYFTVISFGAITTGYAYTQGISESILSIVRGVGSLFGVMATFVFPFMRSRIGLVRSGLFSMSMQFSCLLFCVAAVFAPGSPFFLMPWNSGQSSAAENVSPPSNISMSSVVVTSKPLHNAARAFQKRSVNGSSNDSIPVYPSSIAFMVGLSIATANSTAKVTTPFTSRPAVTTTRVVSPTKTSSISLPSSVVPTGCSNCSSKPTETPTTAATTRQAPSSFVSITLLLTGIVTSRLGLWLSDLTITQLTQESVPEQERGIVGGMQSAFNSILSLLMYVLVIALPNTKDFGLLALMSVAAVGIGGLLYASFAYRVRGHLFHFDKVRTLCGGSSSRRVPIHESQDDLSLEDEEEAMIRGVLSTRNQNFSY